MTRNRLVGLVAVGVISVSAAALVPVGLGPPMICHPIDIGKSETIRWGEEPCKSASDRGKVIHDVLGVLKTAPDLLVRMETLRRAAVALGSDGDSARDLLGHLAFLALDAQAGDNANGKQVTLFQAAYFAGCCDQLGVDLGWKPGVAEGIEGYAWMREALEGPESGEIEFAAALMTIPVVHSRGDQDKYRSLYDGHVDRAVAAAEKGSLLETNLERHLEIWGSSLADVRKRSGGQRELGRR